MYSRRRSAFLLAGGLLAGAAVFAPLAGANDSDKVTICHAAGLDGTTHYVTLNISENAVYKDPGGHFYENGTPQAGHEDDYFGPCKTDETTTTVDGSTTSTTEDPTTTTTVDDTTTTTVPVTTTTTVEVGAQTAGRGDAAIPAWHPGEIPLTG